MTIMYICIQETLDDPEGLRDVHEELSKYRYRFLLYVKLTKYFSSKPRT